VNRRFQAREIEKHAYYQNCCIDSNQILHGDKEHQMPFVGGPNTHLGKIEKSPYLGNGWTYRHEIWHDGKVGNWPKRLNFGGDPDHRLDTGIVFGFVTIWRYGKCLTDINLLFIY